jgi:hypothetical protein
MNPNFERKSVFLHQDFQDNNFFFFYKKQQPCLVRASPFGISRQICFFHEVGLSDQCPQPLLHEEKPLTYLGFEAGTFGF